MPPPAKQRKTSHEEEPIAANVVIQFQSREGEVTGTLGWCVGGQPPQGFLLGQEDPRFPESHLPCQDLTPSCAVGGSKFPMQFASSLLPVLLSTPSPWHGLAPHRCRRPTAGHPHQRWSAPAGTAVEQAAAQRRWRARALHLSDRRPGAGAGAGRSPAPAQGVAALWRARRVPCATADAFRVLCAQT